MIKLVILCRHGLLREGLIQLCRGMTDCTLQPIDTGITNDNNVDSTIDADASLALFAVETGGVSWDAVEHCRRQRPELPILVLGDSADYAAVRRALAVGARAYLDFQRCDALLDDALCTLFNGGVYVPPYDVSGAIAPSGMTSNAITPNALTLSATPSGIIPSLTPRQHDVLSLLRGGRSNKEIARTLRLAEGTIKIHCMAIFRELGVANRTQAALRAEQLLG